MRLSSDCPVLPQACPRGQSLPSTYLAVSNGSRAGSVTVTVSATVRYWVERVLPPYAIAYGIRHRHNHCGRDRQRDGIRHRHDYRSSYVSATRSGAVPGLGSSSGDVDVSVTVSVTTPGLLFLKERTHQGREGLLQRSSNCIRYVLLRCGAWRVLAARGRVSVPYLLR